MTPKTETEPRIVTGVDAVQVYVRERDRGGREGVRARAIFRGEELPVATMLVGELERIEQLGAFDPETPRERRLRQRKARKEAEAAARAEIEGTPPPPTAPEQRGQVVDVSKDRKRT